MIICCSTYYGSAGVTDEPPFRGLYPFILLGRPRFANFLSTLLPLPDWSKLQYFQLCGPVVWPIH